MWTDVVDLRDFYATSLGQTACRILRRRIRALWPDVRGQCVLGLGYGVPYLRPFQDEAERVIAVMPPAQGVLPWPLGGPNQVVLADEADLPLPDLSMDRVLLVHAVEQTEQLRPMLREIWRVLAAGGRMLVVAPNRRGIWAQLDSSPFAQGHPFTSGQLSRLLRECLYTPVATDYGLFVPPSASRMMLASANAWENLGERWFPQFSGVVMIEAVKQIYAATPVARYARKRVMAPAYIPAPGRSAGRDGSLREAAVSRGMGAISEERPPGAP